MDNTIEIECGACGKRASVVISESANDHDMIRCESCGEVVTTVGKVHATIAQEAIGIGASELEDDHVPLGGPPFGETT